MRLVFKFLTTVLISLLLTSCNKTYEPIPEAESCFDLVYYAKKRDDRAPEVRLDNYKFNSRQILSKLEKEYGRSCFEYEPFNIIYKGIRRKSIISDFNNCKYPNLVCARQRISVTVNQNNKIIYEDQLIELSELSNAINKSFNILRNDYSQGPFNRFTIDFDFYGNNRELENNIFNSIENAFQGFLQSESQLRYEKSLNELSVRESKKLLAKNKYTFLVDKPIPPPLPPRPAVCYFDL